MLSNEGMANRLGDGDLHYAQVSTPVSTLACLGLDRLGLAWLGLAWRDLAGFILYS